MGLLPTRIVVHRVRVMRIEVVVTGVVVTGVVVIVPREGVGDATGPDRIGVGKIVVGVGIGIKTAPPVTVIEAAAVRLLLSKRISAKYRRVRTTSRPQGI